MLKIEAVVALEGDLAAFDIEHMSFYEHEKAQILCYHML